MTSTNSVSRTHNTITPNNAGNSPSTLNHPADVTNTTIGVAPRYISTLSEEDAVGQARLLKALADSTRLRILNLLSQYEGKVCVFEIVESISLEQPTVSHHLRVLRDAGLVDFRKKGLWTYYYVQHDALKHAQDLINKLTY